MVCKSLILDSCWAHVPNYLTGVFASQKTLNHLLTKSTHTYVSIFDQPQAREKRISDSNLPTQLHKYINYIRNNEEADTQAKHGRRWGGGGCFLFYSC